MMELLSNPQTWIAFVTLTLLELVLGIDNIIFISILVDKLPKAQQEVARRLGLLPEGEGDESAVLDLDSHRNRKNGK